MYRSATPDDLLLFAPVPLARVTAGGWTSERQIAFVAALARSGVVARAARSVGKSARSAYQLRERPGAESFAAAWDAALDRARDEALGAALGTLSDPERVPVLYRGRIIGWRERVNERLLIAALRARRAHAAPAPSARRRERDAPEFHWSEPVDWRVQLRDHYGRAAHEPRAHAARAVPPRPASSPASPPRVRGC
ncbi:hypothetical protein [Sphingosinithalassobacter sp. LHW66-3]|uniref:hypothetical protein n=1 Tax=Sphingosinithalassobacter sp. LHW66-3 TaxID=3424718 RepID=UPI003D6B8B78